MDEFGLNLGTAGPSAAKPAVKRTARVTRILAKKDPKLVENTKNVLMLKGHKTSQIACDVVEDLKALIKPHCKTLSRKNEILPFEDINSIEFLSVKNDSSLFTLANHTKKRPHNLVIGRLYDGHLLDMYEFGIEKHERIQSFDGKKKAYGAKPLMLFLGSQWDSDSLYAKIQNLLLDMFRGDKVDKICLKGIDHVLVCSVVDSIIQIRGYAVRYRKSGTKIPNIELNNMGPFIDLSVRRTQTAADDLWKLACKKPKILKETKVKNINKNNLGDKVGRIHMKPQDFSKLGGRRVTALRHDKRNIKDIEYTHKDDDDNFQNRKRQKR